MWPKAFAQFIELAPHISRLLPMADRFFQSKTAGDDANRKAIEKLAEGLRGDLIQVTAANAGFYEQIKAFDGQIENFNSQIKGFDQRLESFDGKLNGVGMDAQAARAAAESIGGRLASIEARQGRVTTLCTIALVLLAIMCVLLVLLVVRSH